MCCAFCPFDILISRLLTPLNLSTPPALPGTPLPHHHHHHPQQPPVTQTGWRTSAVNRQVRSKDAGLAGGCIRSDSVTRDISHNPTSLPLFLSSESGREVTLRYDGGSSCRKASTPRTTGTGRQSLRVSWPIDSLWWNAAVSRVNEREENVRDAYQTPNTVLPLLP